MDQPATPARYLACNRDAPRCGGGDLGRHEGPPCGGARRLICSLSTGRLEAGPGGGPASCCCRYPPSWGGTGCRPVTPWVSATGRLGRRDGRKRAVRGGRRAALSSFGPSTSQRRGTRAVIAVIGAVTVEKRSTPIRQQ